MSRWATFGLWNNGFSWGSAVKYLRTFGVQTRIVLYYIDAIAIFFFEAVCTNVYKVEQEWQKQKIRLAMKDTFKL